VKLETINTVAQLIGALGVVTSLFYLAAQIRQNTRSMRAIVVDSLTHSLVELLGPQAYDPKSMRAFSVAVEDWHGATEEDRARALPFIFATFNCSKMRGFSNVKARSIRSNGKVGTFTSGCTFIARE